MDTSILNPTEKERIGRCFLFRSIDEDKIAGILEDEKCVLNQYAKGDTVYDEHTYRRAIGLVLSGNVDVIKSSPDGGSYVMNGLEPGSLFGAAAVFTDTPEYVTTLTAKTACRIVFFTQELLSELIRKDPLIAENYISFLSNRIRFLNDRIAGLLITNTTGLLRHWLNEHAVTDNGTLKAKLNLSMSALASQLNMGRASLYRSMDELEAEGTVKRQGREILILRPDRLI